MNQIKIGTCLPGDNALKMAKSLVGAGFESYAINFHVRCDISDLSEFAREFHEASEGTPVATIGYYCNPLQNEDERETLIRFIENAPAFGTKIVSTFAGALDGRPVEESYPVFKEVFSELVKRAEDKGVKIALENCPMGGEWNRANMNIAFNPKAWEYIFDAVPSDALGLEWEPAHQLLQLIDPLPQIKEWANRIIHVHGKDAAIDTSAIRGFGISGAGNPFQSRTPGFGDTDWRKVIFELQQIGYEGDISIEGFHDPQYKDNWEMTGQMHGLRYLKWCRGGEFIPNPWE